MRIGDSPFEYEWISDWAAVSFRGRAEIGWAHHGMAVTEAGEIIGIHPADSLAMIFDTDGTLLSSFDVPVREAHQLTLVTSATSNGQQVLWIADPGRKNIYSGEWLIGGRYTKLAKLG